VYVKLSAAAAFIEPEILLTDEAELLKWLDTTPGMAVYKHYIDNLLRSKEHILSKELEELLASASEIGTAAENIYDMIHDTDMKFGGITDEDGNTLEMTHGRFIRALESRDRRVRKDAFDTYYASFWKQKNTIAAAYNASVKKDIFFAKARKHETAMGAALFGNNIPQDVYRKLIETVHEYLPQMHRYIRMRKKALGVDELHYYDIYTPIVSQTDESVPYEEAKEKVLAGIAPLGSEYLRAAKHGMDTGWIDLYENEGKRSSAYSWGSYGCHPFVLMNYENKLDDMFTLAHEMGHAMHSYFTFETQPNVYGGYPIFLAEVASTVNEALLMEHLLKEIEDKQKRAYLLNHFMEQFRGTVFRQTMFAEFEMRTHEMVEKGEPLTLEGLNALYGELCRTYYGNDIALDENITLEWARIPHFYSAFYVFQYSTGYSAAIAFSKRVLQDGEAGRKATEDYIGFLKSGSSDYAINILKKAGVDMSSPQPVREALDVFKGLLDEMETLI
jgi:oligoendopeptidase F